VIVWCLGLEDILNVESGVVDVDGVVSMRAFDEHRPWVTAHQVEHLGGHKLEPTSEASAAVKATVEGITLLPILNQGLVDSRERSAAVQALTLPSPPWTRARAVSVGGRSDPKRLAAKVAA
jgi:hypothetical protein